MSDCSKIDSLLRLILLLQQDRAGNAAALADTLGVTRRTVHRYLETLRDIGVPWYFDEEASRYRVGREFFLPPIHLDPAEALALLSLAEQIGGREQVPLTRPALLAAEKIRSRLGESVARDVGEATRHTDISLAAGSDADAAQIGDVYQDIASAIRNLRKLRCLYDSAGKSTDESDWFTFRPYRLWFEQRAWYALGHHETHDEVRCLKLNRFAGLERTNEPYAIPDDFAIDSYRGNAWRMIRDGREYEVVIHFDARMADTVSDTRWHATQEIDYHDDGSITFHCVVDGLDEIVYWVLSYGQSAKVIEPPELAGRIAAMAKATAELYGEEETSGKTVSHVSLSSPSAAGTRREGVVDGTSGERRSGG